MRTDLTIDRAGNVLHELAGERLPDTTLPLAALRLTEHGALAFGDATALLTEHARNQLSDWLETSAETIPTDGDPAITRLANARLAARTDAVCLRLLCAEDGMAVRAIVEPARPSVDERTLASALGLVGDDLTCSVERGPARVVVTARAGRRFDAGGWPHEHGFALSLDERGVLIVFAAVFLARTSVPALRMCGALRADAPLDRVAAALRAALASQPSHEVAVQVATTELAPRPSLMAEVFLDHPAVAPEIVRKVAGGLVERDAVTRSDVAHAMLAAVDALDLETRLAVAWRAGDLLLIDDD